MFSNGFHSFCICDDLALSLIFTSFFPRLLSFSLNFHAHQRRTAKLNCLSLRRWTTLAMPGWQATHMMHMAPWMGTPIRAGLTFSWWNSMPRVCTCGLACAVVTTTTMLTPFRRTGCDFVFASVPWRKSFRFSCEVHVPSQVEWHHHWHESFCWVPLQGQRRSISHISRISRSISWKFERLL